MKKGPLLNAELSKIVASQGHTDKLCIGDAGLPVPQGVCRLDLAVSPGIPAFLEVLDAVRSELIVEKLILAQEIKTENPAMEAAILQRFEGEEGLEILYLPHESFKALTTSCRAIVRTGECTPYANLILQSGVGF